MLRAKAKDLVVELRNTLDSDLSPTQHELMLQVENNIHDLDKPEPEGPNLQETLEILLLDIEEKHPKAAITVKEILKTLENIGV